MGSRVVGYCYGPAPILSVVLSVKIWILDHLPLDLGGNFVELDRADDVRLLDRLQPEGGMNWFCSGGVNGQHRVVQRRVEIDEWQWSTLR